VTRVIVPTPLRSYTGGLSQVEAEGASLAEVLSSLDASFPGIRFRVIDEQDCIRPHIKFFVAGEIARSIAVPVAEGDEVQVICALSGG
jgi:sulfur-carrier protein